jgi:GNAT superfamily N-acetyltransferase
VEGAPEIMAIRIRASAPSDAGFVSSLATRFTDFCLPEWRQRGEIDDFFRSKLLKAVEQPQSDAAIFIAEDESGDPVGFVHVQTEADHFNGEKHALVSDLAVVRSYEGRGIGACLLETAEAWAQEQGYPLVALYVFHGNLRARRMYEKHGFAPELLRYVKRVRPTS